LALRCSFFFCISSKGVWSTLALKGFARAEKNSPTAHIGFSSRKISSANASASGEGVEMRKFPSVILRLVAFHVHSRRAAALDVNSP
jgi:hypothetical protein